MVALNRIHVLVEVSGGVVTNVLVAPPQDCNEESCVWLRDYDDLREQGFTDEDAERVPPRLYSGRLTSPPPAFTRS